MPLRSMTGFARTDGGDAQCSWYWEIRTVNGKGLDVRARLPAGQDAMEPEVRKACARHLKRGNCAVNLFVQHETGDLGVKLNESMLMDVHTAAKRASELTELPEPTLETLLVVKGVLEISEHKETDEVRAARRTEMLNDLDVTLSKVAEARAEEGGRLAAVLGDLVTQIEAAVTELETAPGRDLETLRAKYQSRLKRLVEEHQSIDPARLHQEVALLAVKADIEEELTRLKSHVTAARQLLESPEPVGRQLDFLAQEFNREANTICSKANSEAITRIGLSLKTIIDQLREQVQNIE